MRIPLRWFIISRRLPDARIWAALAAVLLAAPAARASPPEYTLLDKNGDGRKEMRIWIEDDVPVKEEEDRDGDGRFERQTVYEGGEKRSATADLDGDGKTDRWYHFDKGQVTRSETDENGDGSPDFWRYFEAGPEQVLYEKDHDFDGKVDERKMMVFGYDRNIGVQMYRPVWVEADRNFDGKIDEFWVKSSLRNRVKDKTGEPMKTAFKIREVPGAGSGPMLGEDVVAAAEDRRRMMEEQK